MARKKKPNRQPQRKKKIDIGKPGDIKQHGSPEEIAEFLKRREASKKRRRNPKGTPGGGRFAPGGGAGKKVKYRPPGFKPPGYSGIKGGSPTAPNRHSTGAARKGRVTGRGRLDEQPGGKSPSLKRPSRVTLFGSHPSSPGMNPPEVMSINRAEAAAGTKKQNERDAAYYKTRLQTGLDTLPPDEEGAADVRVSHHDIREAEMARREQTWKHGKGVYQHTNAAKGKYIPPSRFIKDELAPSHAKELGKAISSPTSWLNQGLSGSQLKDPNTSERAKITLDKDGRPVVRGRLTPVQRRRLEQYTQSLQRGDSHDEATKKFGVETRGRKAGTRATTAGIDKKTVGKSLDRKTRGGRKSKYQSLTPKASEIGVGLSAQHIDKISSLSDQFPNLSDRDLIKLQQAQRETIWSQQIDRNARWAQETRANSATGNKLGAARDPNRVVFFTTSLGHPAPSVPSESLIGQYIIRRRKNMLLKEGVVKDKDVAGQFPDAVRDMHIIEAGTGVGFGAQGDVGAFQRSGFRVGTKKSPGYGKPIPVGSQILYDSQGRPLYDSQGNIRYSEGATRRFDIKTPDLGFRIFLG